jgi:trigger factor
MTAGDEASFYYAYPEDSESESLHSTEAEFFINVEQVSSREIPKLDEEFAKSVGNYATMDELREAIRQDLEKQEHDDYNEEYDDKVLNEIIAISTIKYPPQMLEQEVGTVLNRLENNLAQQNLDIELYLKTRGMDMDALKEELKPIAETRLKKTLTLLEVAEAEKIQVDPTELQSETNRTLNDLSTVMEEKVFRNLIRTDENRTNLVSSIMMDMIISRTQTRLREIAQGIETAPEEAQTEAEVSLEASVEEEAEAPSGEESSVGETSTEEAGSAGAELGSTSEDTVSETTGVESSDPTLDKGL